MATWGQAQASSSLPFSRYRNKQENGIKRNMISLKMNHAKLASFFIKTTITLGEKSVEQASLKCHFPACDLDIIQSFSASPSLALFVWPQEETRSPRTCHLYRNDRAWCWQPCQSYVPACRKAARSHTRQQSCCTASHPPRVQVGHSCMKLQHTFDFKLNSEILELLFRVSASKFSN